MMMNEIKSKSSLCRRAPYSGYGCGTCGGGTEHHGLRPADAQVPDAVSVSRVLPDQLARGSGRGGLEAGHDLMAEVKRVTNGS